MCVGDFSQSSGLLMPPQNVSYYFCEWERSKPTQQRIGTLVLRINTRYLSHSDNNVGSCGHSTTGLVISYGW